MSGGKGAYGTDGNGFIHTDLRVLRTEVDPIEIRYEVYTTIEQCSFACHYFLFPKILLFVQDNSTAMRLVWNLEVLGNKMAKIMAQMPKAMLTNLHHRKTALAHLPPHNTQAKTR